MSAPNSEPPVYVESVQYVSSQDLGDPKTTVRERYPLYPNEVWVDYVNIPAVPPVQLPWPGNVAPYVTALAGVELSAASTPYQFASTLGRFTNMIPGSFGSGAYAPTLRDSNGKVVPYNLSVWHADGVLNVIEFQNATPQALGYAPPFTIDYWQYTGGIAGSGGGGGGSISTGINLGTGIQVYKDVVGTAMRFRTLLSGNGISITQDASNDIIISYDEAGVPDALSLYVSSSGSDSNDGLTSGTPFATLSRCFKAIREIGYNMSATINVISPSLSFDPVTTVATGGRGAHTTPPVITGKAANVVASGLTVTSASLDTPSGTLIVSVAAPPGYAAGQFIRFTSGQLSNYQNFPFLPPVQVECWVGEISNGGLTIQVPFDAAPSAGDTFDLLVPSTVLDVTFITYIYGDRKTVEFRNLNIVCQTPPFGGLVFVDVNLNTFGVAFTVLNGIQAVIISFCDWLAGYQAGSLNAFQYAGNPVTRGLCFNAANGIIEILTSTKYTVNYAYTVVSSAAGSLALLIGRFDALYSTVATGAVTIQINAGKCSVVDIYISGVSNTDALQIYSLLAEVAVDNARIINARTGLSIDTSTAIIGVTYISCASQGINVTNCSKLYASYNIGTDTAGNPVPLAKGPATFPPVGVGIRVDNRSELYSAYGIDANDTVGTGMIVANGGKVYCNGAINANNNALLGISLEHGTLDSSSITITASSNAGGDGIRLVDGSSLLGYPIVVAQKNQYAGLYSSQSTLNINSVEASGNYLQNPGIGFNTTDGCITLIDSILVHASQLVSSPADTGFTATNSVGLLSRGSSITCTSGSLLPAVTSSFNGIKGGAAIYIEESTVDWKNIGCTINGTYGNGGTIIASNLNMQNCNFTVVNSGGDGLLLIDSTLTNENDAFESTFSSNSGGGIRAMNSSITFRTSLLISPWISVKNNTAGPGISLSQGSKLVANCSKLSKMILNGNGTAGLQIDTGSEMVTNADTDIIGSTVGLLLSYGAKLTSMGLVNVDGSQGHNISLTDNSCVMTSMLTSINSISGDGVHLEGGSKMVVDNLFSGMQVSLSNNSGYALFADSSEFSIIAGNGGVNDLHSAGIDAINAINSNVLIEGASTILSDSGESPGQYCIHAYNSNVTIESALTAGYTTGDCIFADESSVLNLMCPTISFPSVAGFAIVLTNSVLNMKPVTTSVTSGGISLSASTLNGQGVQIAVDNCQDYALVMANNSKLNIDSFIVTNVPVTGSGVSVDSSTISTNSLSVAHAATPANAPLMLTKANADLGNVTITGIPGVPDVIISDSNVLTRALVTTVDIGTTVTRSTLKSTSVSIADGASYNLSMTDSVWSVEGAFTASRSTAGAGNWISLINSSLFANAFTNTSSANTIGTGCQLSSGSAAAFGTATATQWTTCFDVQSGSSLIITNAGSPTTISIATGGGASAVASQACLLADDSTVDISGVNFVGQSTVANSGCVVLRNASKAKFQSVNFDSSATYGLHVLYGSRAAFSGTVGSAASSNQLGGCFIQYDSHVTYLQGSTNIRGLIAANGVKVGKNAFIDWASAALASNTNTANSDSAVAPGVPGVQNCTCVGFPVPLSPPGF